MRRYETARQTCWSWSGCPAGQAPPFENLPPRLDLIAPADLDDAQREVYAAITGGPRASQALIHCAKCHAALAGRVNVSCDDVRHLALPVLRHRILASFATEAEGVTTDAIVRRLLETVPERTHA